MEIEVIGKRIGLTCPSEEMRSGFANVLRNPVG